MKIKNLVFCGFMGSILAIGAATADTPEVAVGNNNDAKTLATAKYVKQGVNYALQHATDKVAVASGSALTKTAGENGAYTLGLTMATANTTTKALSGDGVATGTQVQAAINAAIDGVTADATTLAGRVDAAENDIDALQEAVGDASSGLVQDVNTLKTTVGDASSGLVKDVADNATAITTEENRAKGVEADLQSAIDAIEDDYLTSTDKTELEGKITTEENRAKGVEGGLDTRLTAAEGDIDDLEAITTGTINVKDGDGAGITNIVSAINQLESDKQDKLTAGNGVSISGDTISAAAATNGGVVVDTNGISLSHTQEGAMYYNGTSWENLAITSANFPN